MQQNLRREILRNVLRQCLMHVQSMKDQRSQNYMIPIMNFCTHSYLRLIMIWIKRWKLHMVLILVEMSKRLSLIFLASM